MAELTNAGHLSAANALLFGLSFLGEFMDPLHFFIAFAPVAVYFLLLGIINLTGRPFLTTGARDAAALGVAISGFIVAGPMELFLPEAAANRFGPFVWLLLLAFYGLCLSLVVLLLRPRFVVYNVTAEQVRPILATVVAKLDKDARWAGDSVTLPSLDVQLHVESFGPLRNVQLVASGPRQSYVGWRRLEIELNQALKPIRSGPNPYGVALVLVAAMIGLGTGIWMANDHQGVAQALNEMLRR